MPPRFLQTYADEVSKHLDYLPTWPLDYDVKLGDVGVLEEATIGLVLPLAAVDVVADEPARFVEAYVLGGLKASVEGDGEFADTAVERTADGLEVVEVFYRPCGRCCGRGHRIPSRSRWTRSKPDPPTR